MTLTFVVVREGITNACGEREKKSNTAINLPTVV